MRYPEKDAAITGVGISRIGRRTGIPGSELTLEAARAAIADAGLRPSDIDGLATLGDTPPRAVVEALGLEVRYKGGGFETGGLLSPVMSAAVAVGEGRARHVLIYRTVAMMGGTVDPRPKSDSGDNAAGGVGDKPRGAANGDARAQAMRTMADIPALLGAHAYSAANWLAMACRRHMELYGTTKEQLGWVALHSRANAALNPLAVYRDPMSMDDYLSARPVSTPFGLLDCDVPVDGSIAIVVSTRADAADAPSPAVFFEAIGGADGAGGWTQRSDYPTMASADAAAQLWSRTTLRPHDLDIAQLYDGFTFLTLAWLEALGICAPGEGGPFVEGGHRIGRAGILPLNTYGGQLSAGRMHGYWVLHEACLQLRGAAGQRQLPRRPEVAVVSAGGGPIAGCMLLTR
ncbi:thiolase family protein [Nocardia arizonensis]|uniref:thiolase family protein n=1 Tax=Nocardia arizonensis TaxID=1141647 RepID=UPI0006D1342C|nr:thiolase family protein [Nocardia arizonensis]